jgi:hypothetical protein
MKNLIKNGIKSLTTLIISGMFSLAILSLFVLVYEHIGVFAPNPSGATDYKWAPHQLMTTMTEGFAWMQFDENGFNNPNNSLNKGVDILFMGNSHIEGTHIAKSENAAAQLRNYLPDLSVYNIGISSHTIYKNVRNLENAVAEYEPSKYVIIQTSTCELSDSLIEEALRGYSSEKNTFYSGFPLYIRKYCPAVKSIYRNIQLWQNAENESETPKNETVTLSREALDLFLKKVKTDCDNCTPIIVFSPNITLNENGTLDISRNGVEMFDAACKENGILFVDLSNDFEQIYNNNKILPYGFANTGVGSGHLNKYGCKLMAERLAEAIKEDQK